MQTRTATETPSKPSLSASSVSVLNSLPGPSQTATASLYRSRLLAYASGSSIVVEDVRVGERSSRALPRRTILSPANASAHITALAWHPGAHGASILLAAGDSLGRVTVWNVLEGISVVSLGPKDYGGGSSSVASAAREAVVSLTYATASHLLSILLKGGIFALYDVNRHQLVYLKHLNEEYTLMHTNPLDARQVILANTSTGVFANLCIKSLKSERHIIFKRFQIGDGSVQVYDVRWVGGRLNNILFVLLEREIIVFDVDYGTSLWSAGVGRGLSGLRRVVWVEDRAGGGMPETVVVCHSGGEVSVWRNRFRHANETPKELESDTTRVGAFGTNDKHVGYAMAGWWTTKDVGGVGYLEGLSLGARENPGAGTSFIGLGATGEYVFRWDVLLDEKDDEGRVTAYLREMRQGLSGPVSCMDALLDCTSNSEDRAGWIAVGTERGFIEVYSCATCVGEEAPSPALEKKIMAVDSIVLSGVAWLGKHAPKHRLVTFTSHRQSDGQHRNIVMIVDVRSGQVETAKNASEDGMIMEVKVSYSGAYMLLVCVGMPNELWWTGGVDEIGEPAQRLRQVDLDFTSAAWIDSGRHGNDLSTNCPSPGATSTSEVINESPPEEMFAFSLSDARLGILLVKGRKIQDTRPVAPSWAPLLTGEFKVTSCAPAKQFMFLGSSDGTLARWDTTTGATLAVETGCRRITKVVAHVLSNNRDELPCSVLLALLSSSGTFAVLIVDGEGKFKTTKITWSSGVSSVGYASDVSFYSSDVLMVRVREGGVYLLSIAAGHRHHEHGDHGCHGDRRHAVAVAPGVKRIVAEMIRGGLDIESTGILDELEEDSLRRFFPVGKGEASGSDDLEDGARDSAATGDVTHDTSHGKVSRYTGEYDAQLSNVAMQADPAMAELLNSRAPDDVESPLYSPMGQSSIDRAVFQNSMGIAGSTPVDGELSKEKKKSVASKVLKSMGTLARDKSLVTSSHEASAKSRSKDRRTVLASSLIVPQSPSATLSPRHALHSSRALIGLSLVEALQLVITNSPEVLADIAADFGPFEGPARRMAIAASIQWNDKEYIFWKELHDHLLDVGSVNGSSTTSRSTIQYPESHVTVLGELSSWHANAVLEQRSIVEKAVIELICLGDVEAAVSMLLTSPTEESPGSGTTNFYRDALCALGLAYSTLSDESSLFDQAARVIAINASTGLGDSLVSIPLLYATGKYPDVIETLQSNDLWLCAVALAASKLKARDGELKAGLCAFAEHVALRRGAIWDAVGILVGARMYEEAVELLMDLHMVAEAHGLVVTLLDAGRELPSALCDLVISKHQLFVTDLLGL